MFARRLGMKNRQECLQGYYCSQILEMTDGDFAAVGALITDAAVKALPPGPGVASNEGVVKVPRAVMLSAMAEFFAKAA
jgi:hypothetical protein